MNSAFWRCAVALSAAVFFFSHSSTWGQSDAGYPNRPIRLVVPFAPGGASDFVGRILQPAYGEQLGQQVVVDNRSGAAGNIGVEVTARSTADGYTLLLGNVGTMAINPGLYPAFPFHPLRDFISITQVVDVPSILVANPSFPPNTVKEFIAYAAANPGKLNFGSGGPGSQNRLEMESFIRKMGLKLTHVPYKGAGPANIALMGNEVQVMFTTLSSAVNFVKQSRLKALAVTARERVAVLPDVPTMPELGYPAMGTGSWQGVFAPRGTPSAIVKKLFATSLAVMANADVKKRMNEGGVNIVVSKSPADFTAFVKAETERFGTVIKQANITAD